MIPRRCVRFAKSPQNSGTKFSSCQISTSTSDLGKVRSRTPSRTSVPTINVRDRGVTSAVSGRLQVMSKSSKSPSSSTTVVVKRSRSSLGRSVSTVEWNKVYLDRPEVLRHKAKKLVSELDKRSIKLSESSIERLIRGDAKEYLKVLIRLFNSFPSTLKLYQVQQSCKAVTAVDMVKKMESDKVRDGVAALFGLLTQVLDYHPSISAVQFMQTRFTIQKLNLCLDVVSKLTSRPPLTSIS